MSLGALGIVVPGSMTARVMTVGVVFGRGLHGRERVIAVVGRVEVGRVGRGGALVGGALDRIVGPHVDGGH